MRLKKPVTVLAATALAVGLSGVVTASAASAASDGKVQVHACVSWKGEKRIVPATTKSCRPGEILKSWWEEKAPATPIPTVIPTVIPTIPGGGGPATQPGVPDVEWILENGQWKVCKALTGYKVPAKECKASRVGPPRIITPPRWTPTPTPTRTGGPWGPPKGSHSQNNPHN